MTNPLKNLDAATLAQIQTACDFAMARFDLERDWQSLPAVTRSALDGIADLERLAHDAVDNLNPQP